MAKPVEGKVQNTGWIGPKPGVMVEAFCEAFEIDPIVAKWLTTETRTAGEIAAIKADIAAACGGLTN